MYRLLARIRQLFFKFLSAKFAPAKGPPCGTGIDSLQPRLLVENRAESLAAARHETAKRIAVKN
jgi:hypothetical protein